MALVLGTNLGFVTESPVADPVDSSVECDNRAFTFKDTSPATATAVTEIGVWIDNATEAAEFTLGIYADNAGEPAALLGSVTVAKGTSSGWKFQSCNIAISSSTPYHIGAQLDNTSAKTYANWDVATGETRLKLTETTLTNPWGSSDASYDNRKFGVYAVWEAGGEPEGFNPWFIRSNKRGGKLSKR
jgi:hypothetical protein